MVGAQATRFLAVPELLYILAWRDVKVRYRQAVLGGVWAAIRPLVMIGLLTLLFVMGKSQGLFCDHAD
jgi:lipopolysaccharide transport system permease protein